MSKINYDSTEIFGDATWDLFRVAALEQTPNVEARMASSNAGASTFKGNLGVFKGNGRLLRNPLKCNLWGSFSW